MDATARKTMFEVGDVARWTGFSARTVRRWADDGKIPHSLSPGGTRRFAGETMRAWLTEHGYPIPDELQPPTAAPMSKRSKTSKAA